MNTINADGEKTSVRTLREIEADERAFAESVAAGKAKLDEERRAATERRDVYDDMVEERSGLLAAIAQAEGQIVNGAARIIELEAIIRRTWTYRNLHEEIAEILRHEFFADRLSRWVLEWRTQGADLDLQIEDFQKQHGIGI